MSYQDPIIERFNSFTRAIHDAETFDQVVKVCRVSSCQIVLKRGA